MVKVKHGNGAELKGYFQIRFTGIVDVLENVLKLWDILLEVYEKYLGKDFPLLGHHDAIEQLSSLMKSVKYCQKKRKNQDILRPVEHYWI